MSLSQAHVSFKRTFLSLREATKACFSTVFDGARREADVGKVRSRPIAKELGPLQIGFSSQVMVFQASRHLLTFAPKMYKVELRPPLCLAVDSVPLAYQRK